MRHLRPYNQEQIIDVIELLLPFKVQAPTFATVAEAYAYFTRHQDKYAVPDYADDSDDLPEFFTPDDYDNMINDGPPQVLDSVATPAEPNDDGQRADEERESEVTNETSDEASSSTSH